MGVKVSVLETIVKSSDIQRYVHLHCGIDLRN